MHIRHPRFTYSVFGLFTKFKEGIQKGKGDLRYIYQHELDKACFQWRFLMEILKIYQKEQLPINCYVIKHLILLKIQNMLDVSVDLQQWFINFLIKRVLVLF